MSHSMAIMAMCLSLCTPVGCGLTSPMQTSEIVLAPTFRVADGGMMTEPSMDGGGMSKVRLRLESGRSCVSCDTQGL